MGVKGALILDYKCIWALFETPLETLKLIKIYSFELIIF